MSAVSAAKGKLTLNEGEDVRTVALQFAPRALVLWWTPQPSDGAQNGNSGGIGFVVAGSAGAVAWVSDPDRPASRAASCASLAPIVGLGEAGDTTAALTAAVELRDDGFTVRPSQCQRAWRVHFLAIGGTDLEAEAGWVSAPEGSKGRRVPLSREPGLILLTGIAGIDGGAGASDDLLVRGISISLGACARSGRQAGVAFAVPDGGPPGSVAGAQRTDAAVVTVNAPTRISGLARVAELDGTGFSLRWSDPAHPPLRLLYLALYGVRCQVGTVRSRPRRARARIRRTGVAPKALLAFSWGLGGSEAPARIGRLALGAASAPAQTGASSWDERNRDAPVTIGHVHSDRAALLLVADSLTGALHATVRLKRFHSDGFTLLWPLSDRISREFVYVVLGTSVAGGMRDRWVQALARLSAQRQRSASSSGP